ncbi:3'-5' exonuclease [Leptolyngbya sp. FACHB-261]|uniref:3'-5' exonuclease n=1 Tax=Leptolyngbya sp. FACHB-261 TaxID=2692806 RepID=UPI00168999B1|nr:3'-5' exonuclease [Leptolyngbya sp. FACHB-261]MBD2103760.1 3'-5' exonuclease [Leptolyngbya sp. FACHB-261]
MTKFLALDFETADNGADSACAIGLVRVEQNKIVQRSYFLIRPPRDSFLFTHIHGITWEDVALAADFSQVWPQFSHLFEDIDFIAAHNASFDKRVLYACCDAHNIARPEHNFICTVQLARRAFRIYPTKLPDVCRHLEINLEHHQALSDAEACARIVIAANHHAKKI